MTGINAHQIDSLSLPPPHLEVSHNTVGEGGLGILAPVTDNRRFENNININGSWPMDMGKSAEKSVLEVLLGSNRSRPISSMSSPSCLWFAIRLILELTRGENLEASDPVLKSPHPNRRTAANLFVPNFKIEAPDPQ